MKRFPLWLCLLWLDSSCHTLAQRPQQHTMRSQAAVLSVTSAYDSVSHDILLTCVITNEGRESLALLYEPSLRSAVPTLNWTVVITSEQGRRFTDCSAPLIKGRIRPAREYTLLPPGQQLATTITIQATDLMLSDDLSECRTKQPTALAGTYQLQVFYQDAHTRHQRAIATFQSLPMTLTVQ